MITVVWTTVPGEILTGPSGKGSKIITHILYPKQYTCCGVAPGGKSCIKECHPVSVVLFMMYYNRKEMLTLTTVALIYSMYQKVRRHYIVRLYALLQCHDGRALGSHL